MAAEAKLRGHLNADMHDEETIDVVVPAQLKRGIKWHLSKKLSVWVVVTSQRVLMYARTSSASRPGQLLFEVPRQDLTAKMKSRLLTQVVIAARSDGLPLARLRVGRRAANSIVVSVER